MSDSQHFLASVAESLRTQDNRATSHPVYVVEQKRRIWGLDSGYAETFGWLNKDGDQVDELTAAALEGAYSAGNFMPGYNRVGYLDIWEFVTPCLTERGAEEYIRVNGHNLKEPRIYVASGWRNQEWIDLRAALLGATKETE